MVENVLWPAYFDAALSRSNGRRVPGDMAVDEPTVEEIAEAVGQVGYDATVERDVAYPREHYTARGRVIVHDATDTGKADLIQAVGAYVTALRN
ncbi:signal recognition particle subunit SRP19 [Salinarchaeum laminariae]|uniref:signal recognition particle subunit SRP19 n=1 Tax=Salinarchaeum laminariae TaxID=869888 RepID=UPI0020BE1989|nr:signal recognition particle subunit SRP19 [Salinarchaeum laminariae]